MTTSRSAFDGLDEARWSAASRLFETWVATGAIPSISVALARAEGDAVVAAFGREDETRPSPSISPETTFLVASLTKPLTALATALLIERGRITLDDRVVEHLPDFGGRGKDEIRVRHLLTHTSGLPDMPPDNESLRARHAGLAEFYASVRELPPLFPPGTDVRYQSQGFLAASELVRAVDGRGLPDFLRAEVFEPLGMTRTTLGVDRAALDSHAWIRLGGEARETDWNWNSSYWLGLGAPWGGLVTTAGDYSRFLRMALRRGELDGVRILSPALADAMVRNQLPDVPGLSSERAAQVPWGLGWRLRWPGRSTFFGDLVGPRMYGHWGSTGTLAWVDPDRDAAVVVLTTLPQDPEGRFLARASNALAACFGD